MRPSTTRRTLVFVVALAGVAALYWVPTAVRSPQRLGVPATPPRPPSTRAVDPVPDPTSTAPPPAPTAANTGRTIAPPSGAASGTGPGSSARRSRTVTITPTPRADRATADPTPTTTPSAAPTSDPTAAPTSSATPTARDSPTEEPSPTQSAPPTGETPDRVRDLHVVEADYQGLVVGWKPVRDATAYQVELNGYTVGGTTGTEVALRWFNDDMSQHYVRVRAVGPDGQATGDAAYLSVQRPTSPSPTPSPSPSPTDASPSPTESPSPTATATS